MGQNDFVYYINTLHQVGAGNENAIAEAQQNNPLFNRILVERPIGTFLKNKLDNSDAYITLLTGHAGDGKTSLLLQILRQYGVLKPNEPMKEHDDVILSNNKRLIYIKDFSELSIEDRKNQLSRCIEGIKHGVYAILVANTGPLLNTFADVLGEDAQMQLINAIDENKADIVNIAGCEILPLNIAGIDNTSFVRPFIKNILVETNWTECDACENMSFCPIKFNRNLVNENSERVVNFITNHYIWQQEHGKRVTIRQITAHLAFSFTGGLQCSDIRNMQVTNIQFEYLFSNLFFGCTGSKFYPAATQLRSISQLQANCYDKKKMSVDLELLIQRDYSKLPLSIKKIIEESGLRLRYSGFWQRAVKRMYILFNIETQEEREKKNLRELFSGLFHRFLELRAGKKIPNVGEKKLIMEALAIIFTGYAEQNSNSISLTLRRQGEVMQNVQLVYGTIHSNSIRLYLENTSQGQLDKSQIKQLRLSINNNSIGQPLTLPMLNYFDDLRKGIVPTNIDPLLTHGIDSIKAQILAMNRNDDDTVELLILSGNRWKNINLAVDNGKWILQ